MFASLILKDLVINNDFNVLSLIDKIEKIASLGVTRLVIAPVYYDEGSKSSIDEVKVIIEDLNLYLKEKNIDLKLYPANTIRDNFKNVKEFINGDIGSIDNSNYVLLNVEESNTIKELNEIIYEFNLINYIPIIFGPEKIKEVTDNYKNISRLLKEECLLQLDLASLNGEYGKKVLKVAKALKKKDAYSFIGFEDNIKREYVNNELQGISKKGLFILMKNENGSKRVKNKVIKSIH
ncbi:CpsB/CapC family capsule biosynthesis tyrosine phosphatase [Clostridium sp. AL.422]|uniref:CpsB/CapC family capsule biosynthesis tyrosine phosphatase n=1 Tax=Clostridium TaxID=1485 RepID=UPI00293DA8F2|nr:MULTISPECIES: CpsB/CapC family capsule biosynthesis tyrosine phosphatase [unclassified Clostridium]MDV4150300.1 CpsB/CapC family capsule biosynthesis tyrosine phosphatase [Clostridium sp. AL.422]